MYKAELLLIRVEIKSVIKSNQILLDKLNTNIDHAKTVSETQNIKIIGGQLLQFPSM